MEQTKLYGYIFVMWLLFFTCCKALSQPYGNEWINYNKTYYAIKVTEQGIHKIDYSVLDASIPNLSMVTGDQLLLIHRGQPIPIYVSNSGVLGPGDFIEFFGEPNDGSIDSSLYPEKWWQPNIRYSMFNDTSIYYLTWNGAGTNPRFATVVNDLNNLPPKEPYFIHNEINSYTGSICVGKGYKVSGSTIYSAVFDEGEGYTDPDFVNTKSLTINTPHLNSSGSTYELYMSWMGSSNTDHHMVISLNGTQIIDTSFVDFQLVKNRIALTSSSFNSGSNNITFDPIAMGTDRNRIALIETKYCRDFDFSNKSTFKFNLDASPGVKRYLEISNFNDQGDSPILYDLTNGLRIEGSQSPGTNPVDFCLPIANGDRGVFMTSETAIIEVFSLEELNFVNVTNNNAEGDYIIITHSNLFDDGTGVNWTEEYRKYRDVIENPLRGEYKARLITVDQLYHQFAYGINKHPLAIRNFVDFIENNWSIDPSHLLLIGKARTYPNNRINQNAFNQTLVPTFGHPASDIMFGVNNGEITTDIAVGRISVEDPVQLMDYLNKVIEYEDQLANYGSLFQTNSNKEWMKHALHFGGGTSGTEQNTFKNYLNNYKRIFEDTLVGGNITSFFKTTSAPIENLLSDRLRSRIDSGISMLTFFGHSSPGTFDINFDDPSSYQNKGKYFFVYSNGCFAGHIFNTSPGISEEFVLLKDKAAIGFLATTGLTLSGSLSRYADFFYRNLSYKKYGSTYGELIQYTTEDIANSSPGMFDEMLTHEMILHGDPGIKPYHYEQPDYAISANSIYFNPSVVSASDDTFHIHVVVTNLGKAIRDSFNLEVVRTLDDGTNITYRKRFSTTLFKDTFALPIPTTFQDKGLGSNTFSILIDADDEIQSELSESNNAVINEKQLIILSEDLIPVYPYQFAIVPSQGVTLKASTANAFATPRSYIIEIDTSELFNSPIKQSSLFYQGGGVIEWKPQITYEEGVVYYWRTSKDSTGPGSASYSWNVSSFVFLEDEFPGWNQSHYFQWLRDDYANVYLDSDREFKFVPDVKDIDVTTGGVPFYNLGWDLNGVNMHRWRMGGCGGGQGLTFAVLDETTGLPWTSINHGPTNFGPYLNYHCSNKHHEQFGFNFKAFGTHPTTSQPWGEILANFLDSIPNGAYVLFYSHNNPSYASWDSTITNKLINDLGATALTDLTAGVSNGSIIYFTQKGNTSYPSISQVGTSFSDVNQVLNIPLVGNWSHGNVSSTLIGPSTQWHSLNWSMSSIENPSFDESFVEVYGIQSNGVSNKLATVYQTDTLLNLVDPEIYPYLRLVFQTADTSDRTPSQLEHWRIIYDPVPEAALNPDLFFSINKDTLLQGEELMINIAVQNLTEIEMDSLLVKWSNQNPQNSIQTSSRRIAPLPKLDTITMAIDQPTTSNSSLGTNVLIIDANPDNDQREQYHFNNVGILQYYVIGDHTNPLLDVTFDGVHILNGDIVSPQPEILITLQDENKFLALDDTSLFDVMIKYPDGNIRQMLFDNETMVFIPANEEQLEKQNKAMIELRPVFTENGTYELHVVDRDKSGNTSSQLGYKVEFEVILESSITRVMNYPNPFTTSTRFVFTLTGSEIPDIFKIQIMTIKGTVVREIHKEELGPIRIGRNITEFAWDGTDKYGDPLGNGVYFYRVVTRIDGESIEQLNIESIEQYFKKGLGKMVLLR